MPFPQIPLQSLGALPAPCLMPRPPGCPVKFISCDTEGWLQGKRKHFFPFLPIAPSLVFTDANVPISPGFHLALDLASPMMEAAMGLQSDPLYRLQGDFGVPRALRWGQPRLCLPLGSVHPNNDSKAETAGQWGQAQRHPGPGVNLMVATRHTGEQVCSLQTD